SQSTPTCSSEAAILAVVVLANSLGVLAPEPLRASPPDTATAPAKLTDGRVSVESAVAVMSPLVTVMSLFSTSACAPLTLSSYLRKVLSAMEAPMAPDTPPDADNDAAPTTVSIVASLVAVTLSPLPAVSV